MICLARSQQCVGHDMSQSESTDQGSGRSENDHDYGGLDPRTKNSAASGVSAARKAELSAMNAPLHILDALGIDVPHRDFNPEDATEYPTTQHFSEKSVHLFQNVREAMETGFGDFGPIDDEEDDDDVLWTVVDLTEESVTLTVVGDWGMRRNVPFENFEDNYDPVVLTNGRPQWGY